ncbi:hypothetical protein U2I54_16620 [Bacillus pseudomycoides]|uniref:Uncharacterized protein n=1 Tax=Bacillus bingmayongensis TaxID=1150157 RepID=A0ABU5JYW1_9BACI|nr:hypothetical protein [Bacillus pseudomycoides]
MDAAVAEATSLMKTDKMREMTPSEVSELAQYLDITKESELKGPFLINRDLICTNCNRRLTFLDFVKTAVEVESGFHSKNLIADILCGRNGHWITIGGKNAERIVTCSNCEYDIEYPGHEYTGKNYRYA